MRSILLALACAITGLGLASDAQAGPFGRRGGQMMNCNVNQAAPVQAKAENLSQAPAPRVLEVAPIAILNPAPQLAAPAKSRSGVDLAALAALNTRAPAAVNGAGAEQVAKR